MEHFNTINRIAILVYPKKPFIDWLKYVDPEVPLFDDIDDSKTVYLLPEEASENYQKYVKKICTKIFENQLLAWFTNPTVWPHDRSWKVFQDWFHVEMHSIIYDTVGQEIEKY